LYRPCNSNNNNDDDDDDDDTNNNNNNDNNTDLDDALGIDTCVKLLPSLLGFHIVYGFP